MAAAVLPYPRQGILLNSSPSSLASPLPPSLYPIPASLAATSWKRTPSSPALDDQTPSSSSSSATGSNPPTPRGSPKSRLGPRIRFAPLPDPQRGVLITDDGEELPFPRPYDDEDDEHSTTSASVADDDKSSGVDWPQDQVAAAAAYGSPWTTPAASPRPPLSQLPEDAEPTPSPATSTPSSPFIAKTRRLLKLALPGTSRGLDLRLTPSSDGGGGMSALFRVGSRDSSRTSGSRASSRERSDDCTSGAPLGRCSSAASTRSSSTLRPSLLAFRRTQSSDSVEKLRSASSSGSTTPRSGRPPVRAQSVGQQGTRMLNGRVYGRRGHQFKTSPFETARNDEPEFVEWGYGGMGSNKTAKDSAITSKYAALHGASSTGDDDDGSGTAWLKARREKRAAEAAAKAAAERAQSEVAASSETPVEPTAAAPEQPSAPVQKMPEYVHSTVAVPASPGLATVHEGIVSGSEDASTPSSSRASVVTGESDEEERSSEGTSPDEEEDEEMLEAMRKTSVCAGVEKVSRHKE